MAPLQSLPSQPRQRLYVFDGTWADRNSRSYNTLLAVVVDLIAESPSIEIHYLPGVGARSGFVEKYVGGGLATHQVETNIIDALTDLATNYHPDDETIVLGYSRGAYTGRSFVGFLDRVGLPSNRDRHILHDLYENYTSGKFLKRGVTPHLRKKYNCRDVRIKTMICIDTVGSLGIPHTGIFGFFNILKPFIKRQEFMETNAASRAMFHALALHETRGPFQPTLMHIPDGATQVLNQVWFPGTHGDVANEDETGCIADIVLAWVIARLEEAAGIAFNLEKLAVRFPRIGNPTSLADIHQDGWVYDPIRRSPKGLWRLMGHKIRVPGSWYRDGMLTNESIHITARLRGYGSARGTPAVPGYTLKEGEGSTFKWEMNPATGRSGRRVRSFDSMGPPAIPEATLTDREAQLLGISRS
ncbi:Fc.00g057980.m01.CDS01 [Cosmosporella sp. VM-42]